MATDQKSDLECCGFTRLTKAGQIQIPKEARTALGFGEGTRLMVFAERSTRSLVVTLKPLDADLLELAKRSPVTAPKPTGRPRSRTPKSR